MPIRDTTHRTSRKRRTRGSTMVESALVMLAFTMLLVAIFDVSQLLFMHQSLVERVRVAARWGAVHDPAASTAITNYVLYGQSTSPAGGTAAYGLTSSMVAVTTTGAGSDDYRLNVTLSNYRYTMLTPLVAGSRTGQPITASVPIGVIE